MKKNKYRLEEYIITEYGRFLYTWEMHIALGVQRGGNCFTIGNILVFEPCNHEEAGYLKLEFHEHLMKLPVWDKTLYYCMSYSLQDVNTGQKLSNYFNRQIVNKGKITIGPVKIDEPCLYRLGRYKIIFDENNKVSWQTYGAPNKTIGGQCITESYILFIGRKDYDSYESQNKREWLSRQRLLPKWDKTFAWSHWKVLHRCRQRKEIKKSSPFIWKSEGMNIHRTNPMPLSKSQEPITKFQPSSFEHPKMLRHYFAGWKEWWNHLSPLLTDSLLIGFRIFISFMEKIAHWFRKIKEYFRKYNNR
ncbi:MAG: hypothetical protein MUP22_09665 [Desulfobacterales bacterium]|nr:hypothetical protein [Desulfobacterales bacterium]